MKDLICIFPDTNVFLHFPPLKDIDWCAIADARSVRLVICTTVIHELDSKKSDSRLSARAERAIKEIREAHKSGAEIRSNVTVSIFNREIRATDFPDTLSPDSADDRIVHLAKLYMTENSGSEVAIVTGDYGMELRAEAGGVASIGLESTLRLPNPQDELAKKHRQVVSELNAIKNRLPRLSVGLAHPDGAMCLPHEVVFGLDGAWKPLDIEAEMEEIRRKHPKQSGYHAQMKHYFGTTLSLPGLVSEEGWQRYDAKLDKFYGRYRKHLEFLNAVRDAKARSFWFDLWLKNDGNGLATDIDVFVQFPESVRFVAEKGSKDAEPLEDEILPPEPPEKPNPLDIGSLRPAYLDVLSNVPDVSGLAFARRDDWTPEVTVLHTEEHGNEIRAHIGKLKHGHSVCLGTFIAIFGSPEDIGPFKAELTISTSELTEKAVGTLPFIAKRKETSP